MIIIRCALLAVPLAVVAVIVTAVSQAIEQQADCLSGVWAHDAAINHHFDAGQFDSVAQRLITLVGSNTEISTHGTSQQRFDHLDEGMGTGRPSSCGLSGLH